MFVVFIIELCSIVLFHLVLFYFYSFVFVLHRRLQEKEIKSECALMSTETRASYPNSQSEGEYPTCAVNPVMVVQFMTCTVHSWDKSCGTEEWLFPGVGEKSGIRVTFGTTDWKDKTGEGKDSSYKEGKSRTELRVSERTKWEGATRAYLLTEYTKSL